MVAQLISSIGMHEHVQRAVVECQPSRHLGELRWRKGYLEAPHGMRADRSFVEASELYLVTEVLGHHLAEILCGIATDRVEIHMSVPVLDRCDIEKDHSC